MIMNCKCGKTLSNGDAPNNVELWVYTDKEWEKEVNVGQINSVEIPSPKFKYWKCPKCQRIYVMNRSYEVLQVYALENDINVLCKS